MLRWLSANWIWVVVVGGMLWMHRGHGGHGGHGGHRAQGGTPPREEAPTPVGHAGHGGKATAAETSPSETAGSHRHRGC